MQAAASAAARAAVAALQQPDAGRNCEPAVAALLLPAVHCSITLDCKMFSSTRLASGNLLGGIPRWAGGLAPPPGSPGSAAAALHVAAPGAALVTGPSLAAVCMKERKAQVLKSLDAGSQNFLEELAAIAADSGCTAIVCLPLLAAADKAGDRGDGSSGDGDSSADVAPCLGALTVGFSSDGHLTSASLKAALLLAHALVGEQRAALEELCTAVAMLLLPPAGTVSVDGGECWESETEAGWESSDSERDVTEEGWRKLQCRVQGASGSTGSAGATAASSGAVQPQCPRTRGSPCCAAAQPPPFSPGLLRFRSRPLESAFTSFHARHMLWVDFCAYALCFALMCLEAFVPGTPFYLVGRMGWRCLLGFGGLLPGALLLGRRTRGWFAARRDLLLALTWAGVTLWRTSTGNGMHILDRDTIRSPLYLHSFGWLTVVSVSFQMRFRYQLAAATLAYAVNSQLLPGICAAFYDEMAPARCLTLGLLRVCLHGLVLPLVCCYVFESHARRLFLRTEAARGMRPESSTQLKRHNRRHVTP